MRKKFKLVIKGCRVYILSIEDCLYYDITQYIMKQDKYVGLGV
jgi:hypothetical protein